MGMWTQAPTLAVGGVVAVAFVDDLHIAVGSHSGLGVFEVATGTRIERMDDADGSYAWHHGDPPSIRRLARGVVALLPAAGLWGGELPKSTKDGWSAQLLPDGAALTHSDAPELRVWDDEEPRALGFSPGSDVFVFATASAIHLFTR